MSTEETQESKSLKKSKYKDEEISADDRLTICNMFSLGQKTLEECKDAVLGKKEEEDAEEDAEEERPKKLSAEDKKAAAAARLEELGAEVPDASNSVAKFEEAVAAAEEAAEKKVTEEEAVKNKDLPK